MRYFISLYNRNTKESLGASVVDAESEDEAVTLVPETEGFPGWEPETEVMVFTLEDDDPQGLAMLDKYLPITEIQRRWPREMSFLDNAPDEDLPKIAEIMADHLRESDQFRGARNIDGSERDSSVLDELESMVAHTKGSVH